MDFLKRFFEDAINPSQESKPKVIYGDEFKKKKKKVHFESKALLQKEKAQRSPETENEKDEISSGVAFVNGEKTGIQVKILMRKEEAVRLLSKCKDGGVLEFKDVANELVRVPNNRVDVVISSKKDR